MSRQLTRYENQVSGTRDIDGDHRVDGRRTSGAPVYELDLNKATAVIGYWQLTLSMLRWLPVWFIGGLLFVGYVVIPIITTAPVALFTNKPMTLTEKEAGGDLKAHTNNLTVGFRSFLGSATESIQARQIQANNTADSSRKPSGDLILKSKVVFVNEN
jgi:hypothetical protein